MFDGGVGEVFESTEHCPAKSNTIVGTGEGILQM